MARGLHKLTTHKDGYEVARLLTDPEFEARLAAEVPGGGVASLPAAPADPG